MDERPKNCISERFSKIVSGTGKRDILVAIFNTAPFLNVLAGVELKDYYMDVDEKLRVQSLFQDAFPDFFCFPGIWADYGALGEPSAFGCKIEWPENGMPMAQPVLKSMGDVASLKPIDPMKDGLMPRALEEFQYMWDHLDHRYIEEYGYLEGVAMSFGPVELAAVIMGYQDFYLSLRTEPDRIHSLLAITTESVLRWLKAQEKINGRLKRIGIADHIPGQISQEHFEEFWLPYSNQVVEEFSSATVIYHNEYPVPYLDAMARFKFHVWHFGGELGPVKASMGDHRTLMGNLHPIHVLLQGSPEEVYEKALVCLEEGATGGRFLLSSGGGLAPDTPRENLKSLEKAWKYFQKGVDHD